MANTIQGVYFVFLLLCYQVLFICSLGRIIDDEDVYTVQFATHQVQDWGSFFVFCSFFPPSFTQSPFCVTPMLCIFAAVWFEQHIKPSGVLIMCMR